MDFEEAMEARANPVFNEEEEKDLEGSKGDKKDLKKAKMSLM